MAELRSSRFREQSALCLGFAGFPLCHHVGTRLRGLILLGVRRACCSSSEATRQILLHKFPSMEGTANGSPQLEDTILLHPIPFSSNSHQQVMRLLDEAGEGSEKEIPGAVHPKVRENFRCRGCSKCNLAIKIVWRTSITACANLLAQALILPCPLCTAENSSLAAGSRTL